jgi:hypothetical protein
MTIVNTSNIKNRHILKTVKKVINKSDVWHLEQSLIGEIKRMPDEHGFNSNNFLVEWIDNALGYGGPFVKIRLKKNLNKSTSIIIANSGSTISTETFRNNFLTYPIDEPDRNKAKSIGQTGKGASKSIHCFAYYVEVGFRTDDGEYKICKYQYDLNKKNGFFEELITDVTKNEFRKYLTNISTNIETVTKDEFVAAHGFDSTYDGFYIKANTFKESFDNIVESDLLHYIKDRYQYKANIKLSIEILDENGGVKQHIDNISKLYFPAVDIVNCQSYTQMLEIQNENGLNKHKIEKSNSDVYLFKLYTYEAIRKSQTDKLSKFEKDYGDNICKRHINRLDVPTIDIISADGTYVNSINLFKNSKTEEAERWLSQYNNFKFILVLEPESISPFARMKTEFKDDKFLDLARKLIKKVFEDNNLSSNTSISKYKKLEDREVENFKMVMFDEENESNSNLSKNLKKLLNLDTDTLLESDVIIGNDSEYDFKLDMTINDNHLIEWQIDGMDDKHLTELCARLLMPDTTFESIMWVHGGNSDNLFKKLTRLITGPKYNPIGLEKIVLINKNDLYLQKGWDKAKVIELS